MKYANYANYLIKYAFYRETPGLIEFYGKNYMRLNLGTFDTPRHKILTGFPLSTCENQHFSPVFNNFLLSDSGVTFKMTSWWQNCFYLPEKLTSTKSDGSCR